ncbi:hypothetical protein [Streptomyces sp. NPDC047928]|uniref:hypothetical protein n=1 Tax=unclassified Streptomyces TaxID=2593676 RepID=UPI00371D8434
MIPLAPLTLGDILGGAFATLGRHWTRLLGVALLAYGMAVVLIGVALAAAYVPFRDLFEEVLSEPGTRPPTVDDMWPLMLAFAAVWLFSMFAMVIAQALVSAGCSVVLREAVLGRPTTFGAVWRRSWSRVGAVIRALLLMWCIGALPLLLFGLGFFALNLTLLSRAVSDPAGPPGWLIALGLLGGLAAAPAAVWLWVRFSLAPAVVVFEGGGAVAALSRSARLVRGDWWRVFGISLLGFVIAAVAAMVIQIPLSFLNLLPGTMVAPASGTVDMELIMTAFMVGMLFTLLGQLLGQAITSAFPQLVTALLYVDRRIRTEDLAPSLAAAAAVAEPTAPAGSW